MSKQVPWNKIILEEFIRIGGLTETEEIIMRTRVKGWSRVKQADELGMSIASVDRAISSKYLPAEKFSPILPPRKDSVEETFKMVK